MTAENDRLLAAHRYARAGWPVFPCVTGEKLPATRNGFKDATTDPEQISRWWDSNPGRNVAIATGHPGPDVLDVDRYKDGSGFASYNELKRAGLVPDGMAIVRTPSGGFHQYFRGSTQRNGHMADHHIDYRSQGGYVVAPPSVVSGRQYEVVQHQPSGATFNWEAARQHLQPAVAPKAERQAGREPERPRDPTSLADWVSKQPEGNRNAGLFWAANRALEAGRADALDSIARGARQAGLDEREVTRTIQSAMQTTADRPAEPRPFRGQREPRPAPAAAKQAEGAGPMELTVVDGPCGGPQGRQADRELEAG